MADGTRDRKKLFCKTESRMATQGSSSHFPFSVCVYACMQVCVRMCAHKHTWTEVNLGLTLWELCTLLFCNFFFFCCAVL